MLTLNKLYITFKIKINKYIKMDKTIKKAFQFIDILFKKSNK